MCVHGTLDTIFSRRTTFTSTHLGFIQKCFKYWNDFCILLSHLQERILQFDSWVWQCPCDKTVNKIKSSPLTVKLKCKCLHGSMLWVSSSLDTLPDFFCQVLEEPDALQSEELHFLRPVTQKLSLSLPLIDEWWVDLAAYRCSRAHFSFKFSFKFKCL